MNFLAIDSSTSILSVAVSRGEEIFCMEADAGMKHSELVMDYIDTLMKKAALKPEDLNAVICTGGPGSFTGLRIGYSIAKGLALSLSIPFVPIPTLNCVAYENTQGIRLAAIESKKNSYYYAFFRANERLTDDKDGDPSQIAKEVSVYDEKITLTGSGAPLLYESLENVTLKFEKKGYSKELIHIAKNIKILDNDNTEYLYSGPEYVRESL